VKSDYGTSFDSKGIWVGYLDFGLAGLILIIMIDSMGPWNEF
jgi:hypothetical protein